MATRKRKSSGDAPFTIDTSSKTSYEWTVGDGDFSISHESGETDFHIYLKGYLFDANRNALEQIGELIKVALEGSKP